MNDFIHKERGDCCQCENVANTQSQYPIGTGNTSTTATFSSLPNGWEVRPLRAFLRSVSVRNRPDEQLLSVTREEGVIVRDVSSKEENHNYIPEDLSNYKFVEEGQFVINKMKSWQGSYGVSAYDGLVSPAYFVYDLDFPCKEYFNLAIRSKTYVQYFQRFSKGIRVDQWDLMPEALKLIPFAYPPLPEQKAIVAYLDAETGRIDKAIAAEEKMIALLQERREIVINEAVGGGDLSHAEAQRGRGGKGWKTRRLKTLATCNDETLPENTSEFVRIEYIEISDVDESRGIFNSTFHVFKDAPSRARRITRKGDVIISTVRTYLKAIATIEREGLVVSTGFAVLRARTSVLPRFLAYAVKSAVFKDNVVRYSTGTSYPAINASDLMCLSVPLPPLPEQEAIVERLDRETGKIDRAIEVKRRQIELLRERRQIVIDEVVTGKVKVA